MRLGIVFGGSTFILVFSAGLLIKSMEREEVAETTSQGIIYQAETLAWHVHHLMQGKYTRLAYTTSCSSLFTPSQASRAFDSAPNTDTYPQVCFPQQPMPDAAPKRQAPVHRNLILQHISGFASQDRVQVWHESPIPAGTEEIWFEQALGQVWPPLHSYSFALGICGLVLCLTLITISWLGYVLRLRMLRKIVDTGQQILRGDSKLTMPFLQQRGTVAATAQLLNEMLKAQYALQQEIVQLQQQVREHEQTTTALRKQEYLYQMLLEQAPEGIFIANAEGVYVGVNDQACFITGYTRDELLQLNIFSLLTTPDTQIPCMEQLMAGQTLHLERMMIRKDHSTFPAEISVKLLSDGSFQGFVRDVTERQRVESQLIQVQKIESIGQMAGGIAHDFNNLMTAIGVYADLALSDLPEISSLADTSLAQTHLNTAVENTRHDLQQIVKTVQRATILTQKLLTFARRQPMNLQPTNLNALILDLESILQRLLPLDISLNLKLSQEAAIACADRTQIEQVLINLVVNARDAMPDGGTITLSTAHVQLDTDYALSHMDIVAGPYVMLAVQDTGTGMDPEIQQHIFEPFFTTKEAGKGTGLGLSTCYGIAKQHNGAIWVYSEKDHGTIVKVYLPRAKQYPTLRLPKSRETSLPRGSETLLVVEDDRAVRTLTVRALRDYGYVVLEASNGIEAIRLAREHYPSALHLLLTDTIMPHMGGNIAAQQISELYPAIRILYMSGYIDTPPTLEVNGEQMMLTKPFTPGALILRIREILNGT